LILAKRITAIKKCLGYTQKQMAEKLGIEPATYCGYETEAGNLKFNTLIKIAAALECSVPFLVDIDSTIYNYKVWKQASA
jgi:transcriptional regulator with XRE-family HTH domain